jgi:hypothetical protein
MACKAVMSLLLSVILLTAVPVWGAEEEKPAQGKSDEQKPVEQTTAPAKPTQPKQVQQKPPQMKSRQQKMDEAYQKIFNPKNKKPTCAKPPRSKGGIAVQTSGHYISHEHNMKVNHKDYEKKYKQYLKEVQKINEEEKKLLEEQKRKKEAGRLKKKERLDNAKQTSN